MLVADCEIGNQCLSVPCVLTGNGVDRVVEANLSERELAALSHSAAVLKQSIRGLNQVQRVSFLPQYIKTSEGISECDTSVSGLA